MNNAPVMEGGGCSPVVHDRRAEAGRFARGVAERFRANRWPLPASAARAKHAPCTSWAGWIAQRRKGALSRARSVRLGRPRSAPPSARRRLVCVSGVSSAAGIDRAGECDAAGVEPMALFCVGKRLYARARDLLSRLVWLNVWRIAPMSYPAANSVRIARALMNRQAVAGGR